MNRILLKKALYLVTRILQLQENPTQIWAGFTSQPTELYQVYETNDFYLALTHQMSDQNRYLWAPDTVIVSMWWQQDIYQEDTLKLVRNG